MVSGHPSGDCDGVNEDMRDVYHRLWVKSGWTRARIARELGVNYSSVYRWETGETRPEVSKLKLLASLIGEPIEIGPEKTSPPASGPAVIDSAEADLLSALRSIRQPERRTVVNAMSQMIRAINMPQDQTVSAVARGVIDRAVRSAKKPAAPSSGPRAAGSERSSASARASDKSRGRD